MGLTDTRPTSFQSEVFWGMITNMEVLKVGSLDIGSKPFTPQGEAGGCEFPPTCVAIPGVRLIPRVCLSFSYPFPLGYFLLHPLCRSHLANFWIFSRGNCSVWISRFSVSRGEMSLSWTGPFCKFYMLVMLSSEISVVSFVVHLAWSPAHIFRTKPKKTLVSISSQVPDYSQMFHFFYFPKQIGYFLRSLTSEKKKKKVLNL